MRHYVNLTSGLPWLARLDGLSLSFVRIQSTACEQKRWSQLVLDCDYDFLLALQGPVTIYDCSRAPRMPRALWQGLPFLVYACERAFGYPASPALGRPGAGDMRGYFDEVYATLDERALAKLRFLRRVRGFGASRPRLPERQWLRSAAVDNAARLSEFAEAIAC